MPVFGHDWLRLANADRVRDHLRRFAAQVGEFDDVEIFTPGCSTIAASRNSGIAQALLADCDRLLFNDADSVVPFREMAEALALCQYGGVVYAYTLYCRLDESSTLKFTGAGDLSGVRLECQMMNPPSIGCVAVSADSCPRFDENYRGWGYEDIEWAHRAGVAGRVDGPLYHLWHGGRNADDSPEDSDPAQVAANLERWQNSLKQTA